MIGEHIQEADANPGWGLACCPQPDACTNCHTPYLVSRIEQTVMAEDPGRASLIDKEERSMAEDTHGCAERVKVILEYVLSRPI